MIKVIEHGNTHRYGRCPKCGCRFEYMDRDINKGIMSNILMCPECKVRASEEDFRDE